MPIYLHRTNLATAAVGVLFVIAGIYGYFHVGHFVDTAREAEAVVIDVANESAATRKGRTHPVVRFRTAEGVDVTVQSDEHHNVKPGDTLRLLYDPAVPQTIEITTLERAQRRRSLFAGISVAVGLFVCFLGVRQKLS